MSSSTPSSRCPILYKLKNKSHSLQDSNILPQLYYFPIDHEFIFISHKTLAPGLTPHPRHQTKRIHLNNNDIIKGQTIKSPYYLYYKSNKDDIDKIHLHNKKISPGENIKVISASLNNEKILVQIDGKIDMVLSKTPPNTAKEIQLDHKNIITDLTLGDPINLHESLIAHSSKMGDYNRMQTLLINDVNNEIINGLDNIKKKCGRLKDFKLPKNINTDDNMIKIIKKLVKNEPDFTCCDNVDMEEFVLKSSIVPCSNLIPDKYKEYGNNYNPRDPSVGEEQHHDKEVYSSQIPDKFSVSVIVLICFMVFIILLNLV